VFQADALLALQNLHENGRRFQCAVMDPPYASGSRTETSKPSSGAMVRGKRWANRPIDCDQMTTTGFVWLMREVALIVREMLDEGASLFSFIDWRMWPNLVGALESCNLRVNQMIVWDKTSFGMGNGFRSQHELIVHASKGVPRVHDHAFGNVLRYKRADDAHHPSPKPPELIADLLKVGTCAGDEVLDPFMGSGPTLVAASLLGRKATGIDCVEDHCRTAVARLGAVGRPEPVEKLGPLFGR
jgi:site-specific DNA-methyltransferase (adenine-specific)